MAALQKFKLLATQCAVVGRSPTRSPTTSPVIHLRRRKTLRMLLNRSSSSSRRLSRRNDDSPDLRIKSPEKCKEQLVVSRKLKDLFVCSPPPLDDGVNSEREGRGVRDGLLPETGCAGGGGFGSGRQGGIRSLRPFSATFRQRLLRRAWRPVLVSIPE